MARKDAPRIAYASAGEQLYVHLDGQATHRVALAADAVMREFRSQTPNPPLVVLDLSGARYIDSTFAGWLVRVRKDLERVDGRLVLAGATDGAERSLQIMGIAPLFVFRDVTPPPDVRTLVCPEEEIDAPTIEFMLRAHEELAAESPANAEAFRRIAEQLRAELTRRGHAAGP